MPEISRFYGLVVRMFGNDHNSPHFHVFYGDKDVAIDIRTLGVLEGDIPRRALLLALEWAMEHREELLANWNLCREGKPPKKIEPL